MASFASRMIGAALLRADTYEEVEADRGANLQAACVVALAAVSAGVGTLQNHGVLGILWYTLAALVGWWVWAWVTFVIGTRLLPGEETEADVGELLRTLGFSSAPGLLRLLCLIGPISSWVFALATLWMLASMVVAVRQALDYGGTGRAVAVCAVGFPVYAATLLATLLILGPWPV